MALTFPQCAILAALIALWPPITYAGHCRSDSLAIYRVEFHGHWTADRFPKQFPEFRPPAQFSKTIAMPNDSTGSPRVCQDCESWNIILLLYGVSLATLRLGAHILTGEWKFVNCTTYTMGVALFGYRILESFQNIIFVFTIMVITRVGRLFPQGFFGFALILIMIGYLMIVLSTLWFILKATTIEMIDAIVFGLLASLPAFYLAPRLEKNHIVFTILFVLVRTKKTVMWTLIWGYIGRGIYLAVEGEILNPAYILSMIGVISTYFIYSRFVKEFRNFINALDSILRTSNLLN